MGESGGAYRHRGTPAIERMVEFAPSTGGLALWMMHRDAADGSLDGAASTTAPIVTDGHALLYRKSFEQLPLAEQTGLVAHEVLHVALRHAQRFLELKRVLGDVDLDLFNVCADAIINSSLAHLSWLKLPRDAVFLDQLLRRALKIDQVVEKSLLEWDVERLYRAIDDRSSGAERGKRDERIKSGQAPQRSDGPRASEVRASDAPHSRDLLPRPGLEGPPEAEAEAVRTWSDRILRAHAGDGVHSMLRALLADVPHTRTPWELVLRARLARGLTQRLDISWSRPARSYIANQGRAGPHRRLPWTPGLRTGKRVPQLVVIVDVSGSVPEPLMQRFAREVGSITRRVEASLLLIVGDDRVRRIEHIEAGRKHWPPLEFKGGGGTDFTPMLEEAAVHRPDMVVVLTDLDGPARCRPRWPVIWAVPEEHAYRPHPFGRKLVLS